MLAWEAGERAKKDRGQPPMEEEEEAGRENKHKNWPCLWRTGLAQLCQVHIYTYMYRDIYKSKWAQFEKNFITRMFL